MEAPRPELQESKILNTAFCSLAPIRSTRLRLTLYTDYALRLLVYLGINGDRNVTIAEIAKTYSVSTNHLMKVAHQLGVAGYVLTVRGRSGGLRLAKPPEAIGLGEVIRHTEPDMALVQCFSPVDAHCAIRRFCVLRTALERAKAAFLEVLDGYTLGDLAEPGGPLRDLLSIALSDAQIRVGEIPHAKKHSPSGA